MTAEKFTKRYYPQSEIRHILKHTSKGFVIDGYFVVCRESEIKLGFGDTEFNAWIRARKQIENLKPLKL
jgi:hypothetical protein